MKNELLLVNDDGIHTEGIRVLARELEGPTGSASCSEDQKSAQAKQLQY